MLVHECRSLIHFANDNDQIPTIYNDKNYKVELILYEYNRIE